jgi:hypothetical protein
MREKLHAIVSNMLTGREVTVELSLRVEGAEKQDDTTIIDLGIGRISVKLKRVTLDKPADRSLE